MGNSNSSNGATTIIELFRGGDEFTTGQAQRVMKVSQQTVIRLFDSGALKGRRVPGSKFRRIPKANIYYYANVNGGRDALPPVCLLVDDRPTEGLLAALWSRRDAVVFVCSTLDAPIQVEQLQPEVLVYADQEESLEECFRWEMVDADPKVVLVSNVRRKPKNVFAIAKPGDDEAARKGMRSALRAWKQEQGV